MSKFKVITNEYGETVTYIPASNEIHELACELMDDGLSPRKYFKMFKQMKDMIGKEHNTIIPRHDSWNIQEIDGKTYVAFYAAKDPVPPTKLRSGHIYFGTNMESVEDASNCGTCNGARCDTCHEVYRDDEGLLHNWQPQKCINTSVC